MFRIFKKSPKKKKIYSIHFKVYAEGKAIAEFFIKAPGHTAKQAKKLAEKEVSLKPIKASLIKNKS